jgi:predicted nuclease with RNAse H fold
MANVLGIGWDVGGWIGRKQGVAVATFGRDGLQWRGHPRAFRLKDLGSRDWSLLDLIRVAWSGAPNELLGQHRMVLAIDAPLGFPRAFARLLAGGEAPAFNPDGNEIDNPLAYRVCDRHVFDVLGKKPLSASFDKLGNNATVAMHHARRLARLHSARVLPFDAPDDAAVSIIEVYPALAKVPKDTCCHPPLQRLLPGDVVASTDECDACICALLALAFGANGTEPTLPRLVGPAPDALAAAREEGWIYYAAPEWLRGASRR